MMTSLLLLTSCNSESTKTNDSIALSFEGYEIIEVDGGDLSGHREANVAVDIGFGNREYWAFTNEYGQLVKVVAKEIILQDDDTEPVLSTGRYYRDEAKVPGVESSTLDEGHVIADSLGGVSNAYNITPQDSKVNRHGEQAEMEKEIRKSGGCKDFEAKIEYPNTSTQIPNHYSISYKINGKAKSRSFDNGKNNSDEISNDNQNSIVISDLDKKAEYIEITNNSDKDVDMIGWKIVSVNGEQTYTFSEKYILSSGASIKIGGYKAADRVDLTWEDGHGVWNNSKSDPAKLFDSEGNLISKWND